jgi:tetratricopeptide (TPR) repeat protein
MSTSQWVSTIFSLGVLCFLIITITHYWLADYYYAQSRTELQKDNYSSAQSYISKSLLFRGQDPTYQSYASTIYAPLAVARYEEEINQDKEESSLYSTSDELIQQAVALSDSSLALSPGNVTFWKTRTRVFYTLSQIDPAYAEKSLEAVLQAEQLAPNDPKISYNVGIVYELNNDTESALKQFKKALELKPDYKDAAWALAIFYEQQKNSEESKKWLQYILKNIDPNDQEVQKKLGSE